jgi:hypothetical protein
MHLLTRDADSLRIAIATTMGGLPSNLIRSITWDQGIEMARHTDITADLGVPVYFCDSRSPWQRGSNENANGLLDRSRKVGLGNGTLGDGGLLGAVFVGAEVVESLLNSCGVPPLQVVS